MSAEIVRRKHKKIEFINSHEQFSNKQIKELFINFGHLITEINISYPEIKNKIKPIEDLIFRMTNRHCTPTENHKLHKLKLREVENESVKLFLDLPPILNFIQILHIQNCELPYTFLELFALCSFVREITLISCEANKYYYEQTKSMTFYEKENQ